MAGCTEETVVIVMDIPAVPGFEWLGDCNTVLVSEHLDEAGREAAIDECQARWRREWLRPVA